MTAEIESRYLLTRAPTLGSNVQDLRRILEHGSEGERIATMKAVLCHMASGDIALGDQLLMTVIRFIMPMAKAKFLKKLVLLYLESVTKHDGEGRLRPEFILICNGLRNDLQHPNEFVRGLTLRFLCKIREAEILESLVPAIRQCLEHRHAYVRRNAVCAILSICRHSDHLFPDGAELVHKMLTTETDVACIKNAFVALTQMDVRLAREYFVAVQERVVTMDGQIQLAIIEFLRTDGLANAAVTIQHLLALLDASPSVVKYEAAMTLLHLNKTPVVVKAVVSCLVDLVSKESDNNVKLMGLQPVQGLRKEFPEEVEPLILPNIVVARQQLRP